jgi:phosphotriesterase-related protein
VQTHVTDRVLPALLARGISEAQVAQMMTGNPRRIFEARGSY